MAKLEKIMFHPEGEEPVEFYVLEQTRIGGVDYILVTDVEEGDGEALIMKDISGDGEEEGYSPSCPMMRSLPPWQACSRTCWRMWNSRMRDGPAVHRDLRHADSDRVRVGRWRLTEEERKNS